MTTDITPHPHGTLRLSLDELTAAVRESLKKTSFRINVGRVKHLGDGTGNAMIIDLELLRYADGIARDILGSAPTLDVPGVFVTREMLRDVLTGVRANVNDVSAPDMLGNREGELACPGVLADHLFAMLAREKPTRDDPEVPGPGDRTVIGDVPDILGNKVIVLRDYDGVTLVTKDGIAELSNASGGNLISLLREALGDAPDPGTRIPHDHALISALSGVWQFKSAGDGTVRSGRLTNLTLAASAVQGALRHYYGENGTGDVVCAPVADDDEAAATEDGIARQFRASEAIGRILAPLTGPEQSAVLAIVAAWARHLTPF